MSIAIRTLLGYSEDQARDDHGRWSGGGGSTRSTGGIMPNETSPADVIANDRAMNNIAHAVGMQEGLNIEARRVIGAHEMSWDIQDNHNWASIGSYGTVGLDKTSGARWYGETNHGREYVGGPREGVASVLEKSHAFDYAARPMGVTVRASGGRVLLGYSEDQPRDDHGRWGEGGSGSKSDNGGADVVTSDPEVALRALEEGKTVELNQPEEVSTLLDRLQERVNEAKAKGEAAPNINLCDVTVEGTSLFCVDNAGVARIDMPQMKGVPTPGSEAESFPRNDRGEVDISQAFRDHLEGQGVAIERSEMLTSHLKATQNELNGGQVAGIANHLERGGTLESSPYLVGREGYIVDGHHRWAAEVANDYSDGNADWNVPVDKIDMPILDLIDAANNFAADMGIAPKSVRGALAVVVAGGRVVVGAPRPLRSVEAASKRAARLEPRYRRAIKSALEELSERAATGFQKYVTDSLTAHGRPPSQCMIALYPRAEEAEALAVGRQRPDQLHVTLTVMNMEEVDLDRDSLREVVHAIASENEPLVGKVGGAGLFSKGHRGHPQILIPDVPGLAEFRQRVVSELRQAGFPFEEGSHDFSPHITIGYSNAAQIIGEDKVGLPLHFDELCLDHDGANVRIPLGAPVLAAVAAESGAAAGEARDISRRLASVRAQKVRALSEKARLEAQLARLKRRAAELAALEPTADPVQQATRAQQAQLNSSQIAKAQEDLGRISHVAEALGGEETAVAKLFGAVREAQLASWFLPALDDFFGQSALEKVFETHVNPVREAAVQQYQAEARNRLGISFETTNAFTGAVLEKNAARITGIAARTQKEVQAILSKAYGAGLSIPDTADFIRASMRDIAPVRARMIARTEMAALVNGGSVAMMNAVEAATGETYSKVWMTAPGAEYPRHEDYEGLDGQTVAMDGMFLVGDEELAYPGDPDGSPENVINCRCTLRYIEGAPPSESNGDGSADSFAEMLPPTEGVSTLEQIAQSAVADAQAFTPRGLPWPGEPIPKYAEQSAFAKQVLKGEPDTQHFFMPEGGRIGTYTEAREALHHKAYAESLHDAPARTYGEGEQVFLKSQPEAVFMAGGSATGKSTLKERLELDHSPLIPKRYVDVNADINKFKLPEMNEFIARKDVDAAKYVHEESSDMAKALQKLAIERKSDFVLDGTGAGEPGKFLGKIQAAREQGYRTSVIVADLPLNIAIEREAIRAAESGRAVDKGVMQQNHQQAVARFLEWKDSPLIDEWNLFSTEGDARALIAQRVAGKTTIFDQARYDQYVAKADVPTPALPSKLPPEAPVLAPGNYIHGTNIALKPGDLIEPQAKTGARIVPDRQSPFYTPEQVYLTSGDHLAERYAAARAGKLGGEPHIYEVEPIGKVLPDPEHAATGFGKDQVVAPSARVVRELPLPGLSHWDTETQALKRGPGLAAELPPEANLHATLTNTAELYAGNAGTAEWKYRSTEAIVLDKGRYYEGQNLPPEYECAPAKACFTNAWELVHAHPDLTYVEGYAWPEDMPFPVHHAWGVTAEGKVIDPTWGDLKTAASPSTTYYGVPLNRDWVTEQYAKTHTDTVFDIVGRRDLYREGLPAEAQAGVPATLGRAPGAALEERLPPPPDPELLRGAINSWQGSPESIRIHMDAIINPEGATPYEQLPGSGKQMRDQASALLAEIKQNGRANDVTLYRGTAAAAIPGAIPQSWSESRAVARKFAGKKGEITTLKPGEGFGIRLSDYTGKHFEEKPWLLVERPPPRVVAAEAPAITFTGDTALQVEEKLQAQFPATKFDLTPQFPEVSLSRDASLELGEAYTKVATQFPEVAAAVRELEAGIVHGEAIAETFFDEGRMLFNPRHLTDSLVATVSKEPEFKTWWPSSYQKVGMRHATVVHEFGHMVNKVYWPELMTDVSQETGKMSAFMRKEFGTGYVADMSGYAASSPFEAFAEIFEMMVDGDAASLTATEFGYAQKMRALLARKGAVVREGATAAEVRAIDAARLEADLPTSSRLTVEQADAELARRIKYQDAPLTADKWFSHPVDYEASGKVALRKDAHPVVVGIAELVPTQGLLEVGGIHKQLLRANPDRPFAIKEDGQYFLIDGHHTVAAAELRGQTSIAVDLVDRDANLAERLPPSAEVFGQAATKAVQETNGFSLDAYGNKPTANRYITALSTEHEIVLLPGNATARQMAEYSAEKATVVAENPGAFLGGWREAETGKVHLDVSTSFADKEAALRYAGARGQKYIHDAVANKDIKVPEVYFTDTRALGTLEGFLSLGRPRYPKTGRDIVRPPGWEEWVTKGTSASEREELLVYTSSSYSEVNKALRGEIPMTDATQLTVDRIDAAIDRAPRFTEPVVAWRGLHGPVVGGGEDWVKATFTPGEIIDPGGFQSASLDPGRALASTTDKNGFIFEIRTDHGALLADDRVTYFPSEYELLLGSHTRYRVLRVSPNKVAFEREPGRFELRTVVQVEAI